MRKGLEGQHQRAYASFVSERLQNVVYKVELLRKVVHDQIRSLYTQRENGVEVVPRDAAPLASEVSQKLRYAFVPRDLNVILV